jgi:hypothetical protein
VNASQHEHETELAQKWLEAASAGDFTSAWAASDTLRQAGVDYSSRERRCRPLWDGSPIDGGDVLIRCRRKLAENAIRPVALGRNYEQSGIRQSLIRAEGDFRRLALDMADGATSPVSALCYIGSPLYETFQTPS